MIKGYDKRFSENLPLIGYQIELSWSVRTLKCLCHIRPGSGDLNISKFAGHSNGV